MTTHTQPSLPAGFTLQAHDELDSTNEEAKRQAAEGAPSGTLIVAREQSGGRGRQNKTWQSPPGNVYASLLLRPDCRAQEAAQLSFIAALAVADTVGALLPARRDIKLKWPNDVLVGGRKISGILLESAPGADARLDWLVVGCGINVVSHPELDGGEATSLRAEGAHDATATSVLQTFAHGFVAWMARWEVEGFGPARAAWLASALGLGSPIEVRLPNETLRGVFKALDAGGALELALEGGGERLVTGGEVYFGDGQAAQAVPIPADG